MLKFYELPQIRVGFKMVSFKGMSTLTRDLKTFFFFWCFCFLRTVFYIALTGL